MKRTLELDAEALRLVVLHYARTHNLDSEVVMAALADLVGQVAAVLDKHAGAQPLDDRMAEFIDRARAMHTRMLLQHTG